MEIEKCEVTVIHENVVRAVKEQMPHEVFYFDFTIVS